MSSVISRVCWNKQWLAEAASRVRTSYAPNMDLTTEWYTDKQLIALPVKSLNLYALVYEIHNSLDTGWIVG